jgi:hypothetical protein
MLAQNPLAWMIKVNGFIVDVRTMPSRCKPRPRRRGLIPDMPSDGLGAAAAQSPEERDAPAASGTKPKDDEAPPMGVAEAVHDIIDILRRASGIEGIAPTVSRWSPGRGNVTVPVMLGSAAMVTRILVRPFALTTGRRWKRFGRAFSPTTRPGTPEVLIENKLRVQPELLLVGELAGSVVAAVMAGFDGVGGRLYHLAVLPEYRRRGFATTWSAPLKEVCWNWWSDPLIPLEKSLAGAGPEKLGDRGLRAVSQPAARFGRRLHR